MNRALRTSSVALGLVVALGLAVTTTSPTTAAPQRPAAPTTATAAAPTAAVAAKPNPCKGFGSRTGVTPTQVRIGNASDISGPVPGLSLDALQATKAYVAYFNSARRICGRKLALRPYDTGTSAAANLEAYRAMCTQVFAAVGSMSVYDGGGAAQSQACRLPDLRVAASSGLRNGCTTCFGVNATRLGEAANSVPDQLVTRYPAAAQKSAQLFLNIPTATARASTFAAAAKKRGFTFTSRRTVDVAEFNYRPYVQLMKSEGARLVQFVGPRAFAVRLARTMQELEFEPDAFLVDHEAYTADYAAQGAGAVNGSVVAINFLPFSSRHPEMKLYRSWLQRVAPGSAPSPTGLYAWSAAKLFAQQATSLGGRLTRASLVGRLRTVTSWTGGGLHVPQQVGTKHVSPCSRLLLLKAGAWVSIGGTAYRCAGVSRVG